MSENLSLRVARTFSLQKRSVKSHLSLLYVRTCNVQCKWNYACEVGRKDICSHCGSENAIINQYAKKKFKAVLPICDECVALSKISFTVLRTPYVKENKLFYFLLLSCK